MYPSVIDDYHRPGSVQEAVAAIAGGGEEATFIAGGQSLMQALKARLVQPRALVDLQDVAELKGVRFEDGGVGIGAMTRYVELARETRLAPAYAALIDAAGHVGDRQVRNRGTIGGSVCWNYIAACMPVVALALDATMKLASSSGERSVPAREFIGAPLETTRRDDELLVSLQLPTPPANAGSAYRKWSLLNDGLPVIGACVYVETDGSGKCAKARVGFSGLATGPKRSPAAEAKLLGCAAGDGDGIAQAMAAAAEELETQGDLWADSAYRSNLIRTLGAEMAAAALRRASGRPETT
jgi:aerobic carbon-monoxide dehydrogenase medium subunit